ncbi:unnamed protein product [Boreogadus saida]
MAASSHVRGSRRRALNIIADQSMYHVIEATPVQYLNRTRNPEQDTKRGMTSAHRVEAKQGIGFNFPISGV